MFWHLIRVEWCNRPKKDSQSEQKKKTQPVYGSFKPCRGYLLGLLDGRGRKKSSARRVTRDNDHPSTALANYESYEGGEEGQKVYPPADEVPSGDWLEVFAKNPNSNPTEEDA